MKLIVFSKTLKDKSIGELIGLAKEYGFDGYDLCVRPGYPVNPDNAAEVLPETTRAMTDAGLSIPMVTANFDVIQPDHPTAEPILSAMDSSGIRLIKLGYFRYDPKTQDFWEEVGKIRDALSGWQELGKKHNVKICYHTHSNRHMASNASMLMHLIQGFDSRYIGAFLDSGHMVAEGEEFCVAARILEKYLSIVSLKDFLLTREPVGDHGSQVTNVVEAGQGMVNWTEVFTTLKQLDYQGPLTAHCEFKEPDDGLLAGIKREIAYFRPKCDELLKAE